MNWMIQRILQALERRLGVSVDYLRHVARTSHIALLKILAFAPLAAHRGGTAPRLLLAARFLAVQREDCGTCLQIVIQQGQQDGVDRGSLQALLVGDDARLDPEMRLAVEFTRSVLGDTPEQERWRDALRSRLGERALVDLSLAIASARVFPTLKRSLGYAVHCQVLAPQWSSLAGDPVS